MQASEADQAQDALASPATCTRTTEAWEGAACRIPASEPAAKTALEATIDLKSASQHLKFAKVNHLSSKYHS